MPNVNSMVNLHQSLETALDEGDYTLADLLTQQIRELTESMTDAEWTQFLTKQDDWLLALSETQSFGRL